MDNHLELKTCLFILGMAIVAVLIVLVWWGFNVIVYSKRSDSMSVFHDYLEEAEKASFARKVSINPTEDSVAEEESPGRVNQN